MFNFSRVSVTSLCDRINKSRKKKKKNLIQKTVELSLWYLHWLESQNKLKLLKCSTLNNAHFSSFFFRFFSPCALALLFLLCALPTQHRSFLIPRVFRFPPPFFSSNIHRIISARSTTDTRSQFYFLFFYYVFHFIYPFAELLLPTSCYHSWTVFTFHLNFCGCWIAHERWWSREITWNSSTELGNQNHAWNHWDDAEFFNSLKCFN